jgi:thioredoxin-dependent peroxiredoxin
MNIVPKTTFRTRVRNEALDGPNPFEWKDVTSDVIFKSKNVVLFALPGAFTPTCSSTHLPRYEELFEAFKAEGVDEVVCLSVNDAFVMYQWGQFQNISNVMLLPDGNGEFTRKMGMLVEKENLGFGMRSWRYSMYVEDGVIRQLFAEEGLGDNAANDPFEVSSADVMLKYLKAREDAVAAE